MTLGALVQFRLQLPMINILSKCDTLSDEDEQRMLDWYTYSDALYGDLLDSDSNPETVVGMELFKAMETRGLRKRFRFSAQDFIGLEGSTPHRSLRSSAEDKRGGSRNNWAESTVRSILFMTIRCRM